MSLIGRISEKREEHITSFAEPYLSEGEEIIQWARCRKIEGRGEGFLYLTNRQCVVSWTTRQEGSVAVPWDKIRNWGLEHENGKGPILRIETAEDEHHVRLQVATHGMADHVNRFLHRFSVLAPESDEDRHKKRVGNFTPAGQIVVEREHRTMAARTKRIIATVLGALLVVFGVAITPLPGPWSFPVIIAGLAILASEYDWAKDIRDWIKLKSQQVASRFRKSPSE